jgi:hypothetical protein
MTFRHGRRLLRAAGPRARPSFWAVVSVGAGRAPVRDVVVGGGARGGPAARASGASVASTVVVPGLRSSTVTVTHV